MQETPHLPTYVPPEVRSFTEAEILEELGAIQTRDLDAIGPPPVSPIQP